MSIYASLPGISPDDPTGPPWTYQGSHHLPADTDPRSGEIGLALIPSHITRDRRDDNPEDGRPWPWLRLSLDISTWTEEPAVVLDRPQVAHLIGQLTAWYDSTGGADVTDPPTAASEQCGKECAEGHTYEPPCEAAPEQRRPDNPPDTAPGDGLHQQCVEAVKGARIRLMPDPIVMTMIQAGSGFHLKDEEAAPVAAAVLPVITRHTQQLMDQRAQLQHQIEQQHAALERVHALADDFARAGWSQAAIARRIYTALDQPDTDPTATCHCGIGIPHECATGPAGCGPDSRDEKQPCAQPFYPHPDGDVIVLGPEIFASSDGAVISWRGENYVRQPDPTAHRPGDTDPHTLAALQAITQEMNRTEPRQPPIEDTTADSD